MTSLASPRPHVNANRKPPQPIAAAGRLLTGHGERLPELFQGNAILEIETAHEMESYWCGLIIDPAGGHIAGVKLQKFATGERYNLPATLDDCDCPDAIYRPDRVDGCKHQVALRQALLAVAGGLKSAPLSRARQRVERDEITQPPPA